MDFEIAWTYLLLDYSMKNAMDISNHPLSITTYINITAIADDVPQLGCLKMLLVSS